MKYGRRKLAEILYVSLRTNILMQLKKADFQLNDLPALWVKACSNWLKSIILLITNCVFFWFIQKDFSLSVKPALNQHTHTEAAPPTS